MLRFSMHSLLLIIFMKVEAVLHKSIQCKFDLAIRSCSYHLTQTQNPIFIYNMNLQLKPRTVLPNMFPLVSIREVNLGVNAIIKILLEIFFNEILQDTQQSEHHDCASNLILSTAGLRFPHILLCFSQTGKRNFRVQSLRWSQR